MEESDATIRSFLELTWKDDGIPLIQPPAFSPLIADPSFLFPEETPDGCWALFAHSAWGIHRYRSADGSSWEDLGIVVRNAMRAFVRRIGERFVLFYERYPPLALPMQILPCRPSWSSRIECRTSSELSSWGTPRTVLAPSLPWHEDSRLGRSLSNPCLVRDGVTWRLYYSASLVYVPDCGFDEPKYIGFASGTSHEGPFTPGLRPVIDPAEPLTAGSAAGIPDAADTIGIAGALGAGSMKVLRLSDGWIGLQNVIAADGAGTSRSTLRVLVSNDGASWRLADRPPLLEPSPGWRSSHVYACDCRFRPSEDRWHLYYNARDGAAKAAGRERIGRITARA
ncbi:MAG: glycosyl hydrolase family 43 [Spirochaetes bacterium]|nr:glycosyl hydrolase family 43 [Spirochaetota bacterium]